MIGQYKLNPKTVYKYVQLKNITSNSIQSHVRPRKFIEKSKIQMKEEKYRLRNSGLDFQHTFTYP